MILIADCGSTKTDWCVVGKGGEMACRVNTVGMNAILLTADEMAGIMARELLPKVNADEISRVYFYGAGCVSDAVCGSVRNAIARNFPRAAAIEVTSDLLAAARALCGHEPGIACIMGTGSNSCHYNGSEIVENVSPLGYVLGDEGSGAALGKQLVGDVLKKQLPEELCEKFMAQYGLDRLEVINRVYRQPGANRFLASFAPFLKQNIEHESIRQLVLDGFRAFFKRNVLNYAAAERYPIHFVGSIACHFGDLLRLAAEECNCQVGTILKSPMEGLVKFHQ